VAAALPGAAGAAPGDLDPSFGGDGIVTTSFGGAGASANALAILPNGKIVVAGSGGDGFALARYLADGSLDPVFDSDGKVTTDLGDVAEGLAIQSNGRIVATGRVGDDLALARFRRDGSLDPTFGGDGVVSTDFGGDDVGEDIAILADGKIVVTGTSNIDIGGDWAVARYNPDGSLDPGFGTGGKVVTEFSGVDEALAVTLQDDGRIVVAGAVMVSSYDVGLVRYLSDGQPDPTFGDDGVVTVDFGEGVGDYALDLEVQVDGKLVVGGVVDPAAAIGDDDFLLARFNPDGSLDTEGLDSYLDAPFGAGGHVLTDFSGKEDVARALALAPDGTLIAAGESSDETTGDFAVGRYSRSGTADPTFGTGGRVTTAIGTAAIGRDVAVQPDGSIIVAGWASIGGVGHFALARYLAMPCCIVGVGPAAGG
jgi:uncharacterized delta-60 repeat protein